MIEWKERTVSVDELKPYEKNPRIISAAQYKTLVASIRDNGYHQRCIATRDLRVIGGHQRLKALKELGSGTTLIAAEQTARKCYGMEISPAYVDVIVRRWQTFTSRHATLASTGETFDAVEKTRS